jgi:hypothetical protein
MASARIEPTILILPELWFAAKTGIKKLGAAKTKHSERSMDAVALIQ